MEAIEERPALSLRVVDRQASVVRRRPDNGSQVEANQPITSLDRYSRRPARSKLQRAIPWAQHTRQQDE
ncbi:hypothetical protein ON010_g9089 [Phytophthora cinnamomi]|nr:hypothetical protein ON010_g9089 [Phytophthora cinnamomi]